MLESHISKISFLFSILNNARGKINSRKTMKFSKFCLHLKMRANYMFWKRMQLNFETYNIDAYVAIMAI